MALLTREDITIALSRLGELAAEEEQFVELLVIGGAAMALVYQARGATRDVDAVILAPADAAIVRRLARQVAEEFGWPDDWLNDGAKGYVIGVSIGPVALEAIGIHVHTPAAAQLLAMKLSAWRDDTDVADASRLLQACREIGDRHAIWRAVEPFLVPGDQLKASYAFEDLWESIRDND